MSSKARPTVSVHHIFCTVNSFPFLSVVRVSNLLNVYRMFIDVEGGGVLGHCCAGCF